MFRKYLLASMALATLAAPALAASRSDPARDHDSRYYIAKSADDGRCLVTLNWSGSLPGQYDSRSAADRALAINTACTEGTGTAPVRTAGMMQGRHATY